MDQCKGRKREDQGGKELPPHKGLVSIFLLSRKLLTATNIAVALSGISVLAGSHAQCKDSSHLRSYKSTWNFFAFLSQLQASLTCGYLQMQTGNDVLFLFRNLHSKLAGGPVSCDHTLARDGLICLFSRGFVLPQAQPVTCLHCSEMHQILLTLIFAHSKPPWMSMTCSMSW